jgi:hypothetical protein
MTAFIHTGEVERLMEPELEPMAGGKRDDPNYSQVSGFIPKKLALRFRATCAMQETTHSEALEQAVEWWILAAEAGELPPDSTKHSDK